MTTPRREQPNVLTTNPAATATTIAAAVVLFLSDLIDWATSALPDDVPGAVEVSGRGVVMIAVLAVAAAIGRYAQRWTYPAVLDPEIVALGADPLPPIDGQDQVRRAQMIRPQLGDVPDREV